LYFQRSRKINSI